MENPYGLPQGLHLCPQAGQRHGADAGGQRIRFVAGVNHVFYHGTCYSPDEASWPGWLFYASFEMNPRNSIWRDVPTLNAYVARCQSVLQSGRPDNDILLYWPIHDFWSLAESRY